jgi:hypothetical protein
MSPFEPVGNQARWRTLYELLVNLDVDDVFTYDEMAAALELDPKRDRHALQMTVRRAAQEYETEHSRALEPVPNEGYRVVEPNEHIVLARKQQKKSHRALARGHSKVVHVDLSGLEPDARKAFEVVAQAFAMQMDFNKRMDVRQKSLEATVASITERHDRSDEEIEEMRARLERLEQGRKD